MKIKIAISILACVFILTHLVWPNLKIDSITILLLILGLLPWFIQYIKSFEAPGGFKFELKDAIKATEKIVGQAVTGSIAAVEQGDIVAAYGTVGAPGNPTNEEKNEIENIRRIFEFDPSLAVVSIRIEIEKRLTRLAKSRANFKEGMSQRNLTEYLIRENVLDKETASGLKELISAGNEAVHGGKISKEAAEWVIQNAEGIFKKLKEIA